MITNLFLKPQRRQPMVAVDHLLVSPNGIADSVATLAMRQVLIVPVTTLEEFGLKPGDLRENVVVDDTGITGIHSIPSGSVLNINGVLIRLTVHCEPCGRLAHLVPRPKLLEHKRGYLGSFLTDGRLGIGDSVRIEERQFENIPYDIKDRIVWYLSKREAPVPAITLVRDIGLSDSYCRVLPKLINGLDIEDMIVFDSHKAA